MTQSRTPLAAFLRQRRITIRQLSESIGISYDQTRDLVSGASAPGRRSSLALHRWLRAQGAPNVLTLAPTAPSETDATELAAFLREQGVSRRSFAEALGISYDHACDLAAGRSQPGRRLAAALQAWIQGQLEPSTEPTPATATSETTMETLPADYLRPDELEWFDLREDPFDDINDQFMSPTLQALEAELEAAIQRRRVALLTAEPGSGKSTLLGRLAARYRTSSRVRWIAPAIRDPKGFTPAGLVGAVLRGLTGLETGSLSAERRDALLDQTFADLASSSAKPVLVIDEAHRLSAEGFFALKVVWDRQPRPLAVILAGQPSLIGRLQDPAVKGLAIRAHDYRIPPLGRDTGAYLQWRFKVGGGDAYKVFSAAAIDLLAKRAEHPAVLHTLAIRAMRVAKGVGDLRVEASHVGRA